MKIEMPQNIKKAVGLLNGSGHAAYAVGGCVRDSLLGRAPEDWDVCTSALPEETLRCFADFRTIPTGIKHGTVTVIIDEPIEITTFRVDGKYADNRRPESVEFTSALSQDLKRRDFTINAMALGTDGKIIDLYGGVEDLSNGLIRAVGDPNQRFDEDALRIMRALRFSATLGFAIEQRTAAAIHEKKELLGNIAAERIRAEADKLLHGKCAELLRDFSDVFSVFFPEAEVSAALAVEAAESLPVKLALLFRNISAETAENVLRRMRYDKVTVRAVCEILRRREAEITAEKSAVKRLLNSAGRENAELIVDFLFHSGKLTEAQKTEILQTAGEVIDGNECYTLSALAVNGSDISALGLFPENSVGKVLQALLLAVIDSRVVNEKSKLLEYAKKECKY